MGWDLGLGWAELAEQSIQILRDNIVVVPKPKVPIAQAIP